MEFQNKLKQNVKKDYIYTIIGSFDLTNGVWMLYLASKGLSLFQIGLMETLFHFSSFLMEIPTGAVADIFGRKTSRIAGRVCSVLATIIMIFGNNVYAFGLSFIVQALSYNLESGAGEALIYDSLKEIDKTDTYMKIRGRKELCYQIAKTASLILGGYIASLSFSNVYKGALVIAIITLLHAFSFTEPTIGKVKREKSILETFKNQLITAFTIVKKDKRIAKMIIALELFSTFYVTEFYYVQNKLLSIGHSTFEIGIILACGACAAALFATQTHKLEKKFGLNKILLVSSVCAIISFWVMAFEGYEKYAFVILSGLEGMLFVAMGDYINKLIPSEQRATILSFQSMAFSFFMIILFPIVGLLGDMFGLSTSFLVIAVICSLIALWLVKLMNKK